MGVKPEHLFRRFGTLKLCFPSVNVCIGQAGYIMTGLEKYAMIGREERGMVQGILLLLGFAYIFTRKV